MGLARALVRDPSVLILDEPTSNMDVESERAVQQRLLSAIQGKTLVLITHRLSMLRIVDRIVVLDEGKVRMDGPRNDVLQALQGKGAAPQPAKSPAGGGQPPVPQPAAQKG